MTVGLTPFDQEYLGHLRSAGVLQELRAEKIPAQDGTVLIPCSDGDRLPDILVHHWNICNGHGGKFCHHVQALNGGALLIPIRSPVRGHPDLREDRVLLRHMRQGCEIKGVATVVLYGHAPCAAAYLANLNILQVIQLLINAKKRVRKELSGVAREVLCFFHVDYNNNRKRSYYLERPAWESWCEKNDITVNY
jgi:hypothetical protein